MIIKIGMGEGIVAEAPHIIESVGIGSCVAVTLYDLMRKAGGLAHIKLPQLISDCRFQISDLNSAILTPHSAFEFADTAIPALLEELRKKGCSRQNIVAKIAGGAKMFPSYSIADAGIGEQIVRRVRHLLKKEGIPLKGRETGGSHGRSVEFYLETGKVVVKAFEREEKEI